MNRTADPVATGAKPLLGKTALVTGGAKRIGRELALALSRAGADVAITCLTSATESAETVQAIAASGVRAYSVVMDVRSETSVRAGVADVVRRLGRLDIVVNNAAVFESAALGELSTEAWDRTFETNARGPFLVAREALPHLKSAQGRIINIGSLGGSHAWAGHAHYCASKAALHMLTQTMAKAFAPEISVNCVAPGYIEIGHAGVEGARFASKTPMGQNGSAADVAAAVLFFAAGPRFITGQILTVDGGLGLG